MKITNENFFELNDDKHDDEVNENKSETKQTATDRLRNELRSLFELDDDETDNEVYEKTSVFDETDNEVDEKPNVVNETDEKPVVGETDSEADEKSAVDETDNETDEKQSVVDETDETPSAADEPDTEVDEKPVVDETDIKADENPSVVDKTDEKPSADEPDTEADEKLVGDETANEADTNESAAKQTAAVDKTDENKPVHKRTAAERLRAKLMALRMQDDGKTDVSASEVPVNNHEDAFEGETKVPDDDKIVDSQNAAPIDTAAKDDVAQPADDIDATTSKDDVAQLAADDINTAAEDDVPQQAVDDIDAAANDAASSEDDVSQQDAGDIAAHYVVSPEELKEDYQDNDTLPELPTNDDESNTNDDKPDVTCDEPDIDDESDTNGEPDALPTTNGDKPDEADERIQLKKPDDKNSKKSGSRKKILAVVGGVAFALVATTTAVGVSHMHSTTSQSQTASSRTAVPAKKTAASSSRSVDGSSLNAVKEKLTATAKATSQPYMVQVTALGGGYTMGVITYYPNDTTKTYMDYSITAPKTPEAVTDDKKAQDINKKLSSSLPTINKTITVIDSSKVSMNTYKQSDGSYHTILLYDNKPFGFVTTKADGSMINNVTTYYIQTVQKKNK